MTSWWVWWAIGALWTILTAAWVVTAILWWRVHQQWTAVERALWLTPVESSRLKDPEPGSYALSDAEAAQVEREQMVESQQRAQSRKARGSVGFSGSWRRG